MLKRHRIYFGYLNLNKERGLAMSETGNIKDFQITYCSIKKNLIKICLKPFSSNFEVIAEIEVGGVRESIKKNGNNLVLITKEAAEELLLNFFPELNFHKVVLVKNGNSGVDFCLQDGLDGMVDWMEYVSSINTKTEEEIFEGIFDGFRKLLRNDRIKALAAI